MHWQDTVERSVEIEEGEDGLLDLAGVGSTADQNQAAAHIDRDDCTRAGTMPRRIRSETGQVKDRHRLAVRGLAVEEIADKERMPRRFGNDRDPKAKGGVGTGTQVLPVKGSSAQGFNKVLEQLGKMPFGHRRRIVPPHPVPRQIVDDNKLVLR